MIEYLKDRMSEYKKDRFTGNVRAALLAASIVGASAVACEVKGMQPVPVPTPEPTATAINPAVATAIATAIAPTTEPSVENSRFVSASVLDEAGLAGEVLGDRKIGEQILSLYGGLKKAVLEANPNLDAKNLSLTVIKVNTDNPSQSVLYYPFINVVPEDPLKTTVLMVLVEDNKAVVSPLEKGTNIYRGKERPTLDLVTEKTQEINGQPAFVQTRRSIFTYVEEDRTIIFSPFGYQDGLESPLGYADIKFANVLPRPIEPTAEPTATITPEPAATAEMRPGTLNAISPDLMLDGNLAMSEKGAESFYARYWTSFFNTQANKESGYTQQVFGTSSPTDEQVLEYVKTHKIPIIPGVGPKVFVSKTISYIEFRELIDTIKDPALKQKLLDEGLDASTLQVIVFGRNDWNNNPNVKNTLEGLDGPRLFPISTASSQTILGFGVDHGGRIVLVAGSKEGPFQAKYANYVLGGLNGEFRPRDAVIAWASIEEYVKVYEEYRQGSLDQCIAPFVDRNICSLAIQDVDLTTLIAQGVEPPFVSVQR